MRRKLTGITLLELMLCLVLISVISLGFNSITIFSRMHVVDSQRRSALKNEVFLALEHMRKNISRAIGNEFTDGDNTVVEVSGDCIRAFIDGNGNGVRDSTPNDFWVTYRLLGNNVMRFCPNQTCAACLGSTTPPAEDVSRNIATFVPTKPNTPLDENNVTVALTACRDPSIPESVNNPCMSMESRIVMSSVSTN